VIVVADTSVILNLVRVGHDDLLRRLCGEVWIPGKVAEEFAWQTSINPHFYEIKLPLWIQIHSPAKIPENFSTNPALDEGERAALALALEIHADAILIDEENGREAAAKSGLKRVGIVGILLRAKAAGLVPALNPIFDSLQRDANFWISKSLREEISRRAGEMK
jgi:predicted nucleic acid-binding protein